MQQVRCRNQQQTMKYLFDDIIRVAMDFNTKVRTTVTFWSKKMAIKPKTILKLIFKSKNEFHA